VPGHKFPVDVLLLFLNIIHFESLDWTIKTSYILEQTKYSTQVTVQFVYEFTPITKKYHATHVEKQD
jgi:hypothetical protein